MNRVKHTLNALLYDESGQDLIEYAVAAGFAGAVAVLALQGASNDASSAFNSAADSLVSRF